MLVPPRQIVGWTAADDYPSSPEAEELGLRRTGDPGPAVCDDTPFVGRATVREWFTLPWARGNEKLGGWPGWVNICTAYPDCPRCRTRMDVVLFQFGYDGFVPVMFGDGGQGNVVCCPNHPNVLAYPWTCG